MDASFDRLGEGLRVLEDVARFLLNDAELSKELKTLRHDLTRDTLPLQQDLLAARRVGEDVGALTQVPGGMEREDLVALVRTNARRVQESLRVIEELAKLPATPTLDWARFRQARFVLYELEQKLVFRLLRRGKTEKLAGLYAIIDTQALRGRNAGEVARQAIKGGARVIQLRDKESSRAELLGVAQQLRSICLEEKVLFIMNDYLDLTMVVEADGLHLGQEDLPLPVARKILPWGCIIGCSTHSLAQALQAQSQGADYIAVGSIYPTLSKEKTTVVGLQTLQQIKKAVTVPVIAIGGINEGNIKEVIRAGAEGVAVISALLKEGDVEESIRQLSVRLEEAKLS